MLMFLMQIFYRHPSPVQSHPHCVYIPTMAVTESGFRFFKKAAAYQEFGFKKTQGEVTLKRRLEGSRNPAIPADLRKDIWKTRGNALRLMHSHLR